MKKRISICILVFTLWIPAFSQPVDLLKAGSAVEARLKTAGMNDRYHIRDHTTFTDGNISCLFFLFRLVPQGYMIVSGKMELPPVLAYSFTDDPDAEGRLVSLARADLTFRLQYQTTDRVLRNIRLWDRFGEDPPKWPMFQQWPEPGTTSTGGWLETNWTQNSPYNQLCPMDPVTGIRSIAGCPAVAMAQIVNFHRTINGVQFTDADDYYHNYAGRNYMIDDDYLTIDFPSFPVLNGFLDSLQGSYEGSVSLTNQDQAALTFACGVAAKQVFTSSASGTFGVSQALDAYLKFNFFTSSLLDENDTSLYTRMSQNIMDTLPVHLAVVDPAWSMGHNVVADGYNTDKYFHLNFGWGGPSNGWYLLPEEIPYGLTVVEGAVVDIIPDHPTGIRNPKDQTLVFYPNPACNVLHVPEGLVSYNRLAVYTIDGRLFRIRCLNPGVVTLDLSDFPEGAYLIRLLGKDVVKSGKLIIQRANRSTQ